MEEKGRPWLSKLGVATETTGVVSEWVDWETPRRWALFCGRKQFVRRDSVSPAGQGQAEIPEPQHGATDMLTPPRQCSPASWNTRSSVSQRAPCSLASPRTRCTHPEPCQCLWRGVCLRVCTHVCGAVSSICR